MDADTDRFGENDCSKIGRMVLDFQAGLWRAQAGQMKMLSEQVETAVSPMAVSEALPAAISLGRQHENLALAMEPLIEDVIEKSATKNQERMVRAISPIIGPAIRRAVAEAVKGLAQTLQTIVERAVTFEGLKWRMEAARSGLPLGVVSLQHVFVFRVEHVLLIHRKSAKIIGQMSAPEPLEIDEMTFAGMLEAVKTFGEDVFSGSGEQRLRVLDFEFLKVLVSEGPHAVIALVVSGSPSPRLSESASDICARIHRGFWKELSRDLPDQNELRSVDSLLEIGLQEQKRAGRRSQLSRGLALCILVVVCLAVTGFVGASAWNKISRWQRFNDFVESLSHQSDLMIGRASREGGKYRVDVLAADPVLAHAEVSRRFVESGFEKTELELRIFQSALISAERLGEREKAYDLAKSAVTELKLSSFSYRDRVRFVRAVAPLFAELDKAARAVGRRVAVEVRYTAGLRANAESILWSIQYLLQLRGSYDYHFLRLRTISESRPARIQFSVVEAE